MAKKTANRTRAGRPRTREDIPPPPEDAAEGESAFDSAPPVADVLPPEASDRIRTLTLPVDEHGHVDWSSTKGKKRARLRALVNDPNLAKEIGLNVEPGTAAQGLTAEMVGGVYLMTGGIVSGGLAARGVPADVAQTLAFSEDEAAALGPLTAKVVNKWIGPFKYSDEAMLAMALGRVLMVKVMMFRAAMDRWEESKRNGTQPTLAFDAADRAGA
jgi:hypothetical protein